MAKCAKKVSDHTGFQFFPCGKPAKFRVWFGDGPVVLMCGIHAKQADRRKGRSFPVGKP